MAMGTKLKDTEKKPTRYFSDKQEKAVSKATGGNQTPNSGATDFGGKGDVLTEQFLLECKTKMSHSNTISLKKEWFEKNRQEAAFIGKPYTALVFNFGPEEENHYVIDEWLFQELLEYLQKKGN